MSTLNLVQHDLQDHPTSPQDRILHSTFEKPYFFLGKSSNFGVPWPPERAPRWLQEGPGDLKMDQDLSLSPQLNPPKSSSRLGKMTFSVSTLNFFQHGIEDHQDSPQDRILEPIFEKPFFFLGGSSIFGSRLAQLFPARRPPHPSKIELPLRKN